MIDERVKAIKARIQARKLDVGEFTENEYTIQGAKQGLLDDDYAPSFADLAANAYSDIAYLLSLLEWRPIETAPKDGKRILAKMGDSEPFVCRWQAGAWTIYREPSDNFIKRIMGIPSGWLTAQPTVWRPIPKGGE